MGYENNRKRALTVTDVTTRLREGVLGRLTWVEKC